MKLKYSVLAPTFGIILLSARPYNTGVSVLPNCFSTCADLTYFASDLRLAGKSRHTFLTASLWLIVARRFLV